MKIRLLSYYLLGFAILLLMGCNIWVYLQQYGNVEESLEELNKTKVGLVLGTSKHNRSGSENEFFANRMKAVSDLYFRGVVTQILVSGDSSDHYNEPKDMKSSLVRLGVPETAILQDFSGVRTLDSIVRSKEVFGFKNLIIVTQEFHLYRALFIAAYHGIDAQGFVAQDPEEIMVRILLRELIARPLAIFDLYIFKTTPNRLG